MTTIIQQPSSYIQSTPQTLPDENNVESSTQNQFLQTLTEEKEYFEQSDEEKYKNFRDLFQKISSDNIEEIITILDDFTAEEANEAFKFTEKGLSDWAEELELKITDENQRSALFKTLASKLDGATLVKVYNALPTMSMKVSLNTHICVYADSDAKYTYVQALANQTTDGSNQNDLFKTEVIECWDLEARMILDVLASVAYDPTAHPLNPAETHIDPSELNNYDPKVFEDILALLNDKQFEAVMASSVIQLPFDIDGRDNGSLRGYEIDLKTFNTVTNRIARIEDSDIKAQRFNSLAKLPYTQFDTLSSDEQSRLLDSITYLLKSDPIEIVSSLREEKDRNGESMSIYLAKMMELKKTDEIASLINTFKYGPGEFSADFLLQPSEYNSETVFNNAKNIGYFAGCIDYATGILGLNQKEKADQIKNIVSKALETASTILGISVPELAPFLGIVTTSLSLTPDDIAEAIAEKYINNDGNIKTKDLLFDMIFGEDFIKGGDSSTQFYIAYEFVADQNSEKDWKEPEIG